MCKQDKYLGLYGSKKTIYYQILSSHVYRANKEFIGSTSSNTVLLPVINFWDTRKCSRRACYGYVCLQWFNSTSSISNSKNMQDVFNINLKVRIKWIFGQKYIGLLVFIKKHKSILNQLRGVCLNLIRQPHSPNEGNKTMCGGKRYNQCNSWASYFMKIEF